MESDLHLPVVEKKDQPYCIVVTPEEVFIQEITSARNGIELIEATEKLGKNDKTNSSIAFNRAKKVLVDRGYLVGDRFVKGGYGKMCGRDRNIFRLAIEESKDDLFEELKKSFLPPLSKPGVVNIRRESFQIENDFNSVASVPNKRKRVTTDAIFPVTFPDEINDTLNQNHTLNLNTEAGVKVIDIDDVQQSVHAVHTAHAQLLAQQALTIQASRLREAMNEASFQEFTEEEKSRIKEKYIESLLGKATELNVNNPKYLNNRIVAI